MKQNKQIFIFFQHLVPHQSFSRLMGFLGKIKIQWIKVLLMRIGTHYYPLNMEEAIIEDPFMYETCEELFIRKLKPNARTVDSDPNTFTSPSDGTVTQLEKIQNQHSITAKEHLFSIEELLATKSHPFHEGVCATIYLAPSDYHRVHMPFDGTITSMTYIPGKLYSVHPKLNEQIPNILSLNERVVINADTKLGKLSIVLVGAMNVGNIHIDWHGQVNPGHPHSPKTWTYEDKEISLKKGQELGYFTFGSTVVLLFNNPSFDINPSISIGSHLLYGQPLGQ